MRETTRTHVCTHACTHIRTHPRIHTHACTRGINTRNARERFARLPSCVYIGCPGRKRARPRAGVTLFSNFPFMGYRLVSICRFVTTPGDLHGQIGLLHAVVFPSSLLLFLLLASFYITIFRHHERDLPPDIPLRDNLFFLLLFFCVSFLFFFVRPPVFPGR